MTPPLNGQLDRLLAAVPTRQTWVRKAVRACAETLVRAAVQAERARCLAWLAGSCERRPADAEPCGRCDPCVGRRGVEAGGEVPAHRRPVQRAALARPALQAPC